jgi:peptidoglycan hydrolase-like protein with peptidoglycan-binding domain
MRKQQETAATEQRHTFKRKGVPEFVHITMEVDGQALSNEPWEVDIDGQTQSGTTDGEGNLEFTILPTASRGVLRILEREFPLAFGNLDPIDTATGVQARLNQLGYPAGAVDGDIGDKTTGAVKLFQEESGIDATGKLDNETRQALKNRYGA